MSYAKVTLYRVDWAAEQNFMVDNIDTYLAELDITADRHLNFNDVQFQKHDLDLEIKLPIGQGILNRKWNYAKIVNSDDESVWGDPIPFYYYIGNYTWTSQSSCKLQLSMDTLNTFRTYIVGHFTDKTHVLREHKDRFQTATKTNTKFRRKLDKMPEIQGLIKYQIDSAEITGGSWYLVYNSSSASPDINQGIDIYLVPKVSNAVPALIKTGLEPDGFYTSNSWFILGAISLTITTYGGTTATVSATGSSTDFFRLTTDGTYLSLYRVNCVLQSYTIGGAPVYKTTYTLVADNITNVAVPSKTLCKKMSNSDVRSNVDTTGYTLYEALETNMFNNVEDRYIETTSVGVYLSGIDEIDRTKSTIVKIIECPYQPIQVVANQTAIESSDLSTGGKVLYLMPISREQEFYYHLVDSTDDDQTEFNFFEELFPTLPSVNNRISTNKNMLYESKLYTSEFYERRYMYDNFTKVIPLEQLDTSYTSPFLDIYYKQSNGLSSNMLFDFQPNTDWDTQENYENILIVKKNSELPLYHNSYLDYMRTGYNFDIKAKNLAYQQEIINMGIQLGSSVVSFGANQSNPFALTSSISMATNAIQSASSTIFGQIQAQNSIDSKVAEAKAQATNVSTNDDLNLCNYYTHNNLWQTKYSVNDLTKNKLFKLFYFTGYTTDEYKVPVINSRYRFNYLQADIDLDDKFLPMFLPYYDDVKARFNLGVTVIHTLNDFLQEKENWETWLI